MQITRYLLRSQVEEKTSGVIPCPLDMAVMMNGKTRDIIGLFSFVRGKVQA